MRPVDSAPTTGEIFLNPFKMNYLRTHQQKRFPIGMAIALGMPTVERIEMTGLWPGHWNIAESVHHKRRICHEKVEQRFYVN